MTRHAADLTDFIEASPSPFHAVESAAALLTSVGCEEVEQLDAERVGTTGFVRRGGAIVAWRLPEGAAERPPATPFEFRIIGAHTDSPNLRLKPYQAMSPQHPLGLRQLGVEPYGGLLRNSWLNRDLGLSGRVFLRSDSGPGRLEEVLIHTDHPVAIVPQLAIHLDREANTALSLNPQTQMNPIVGLPTADEATFREWLADELGEREESILSYDLMLHDVTPPRLVGRNSDLFAAPRLDNLCSSYGALTAFTSQSAPTEHGQVIALFDHEEVGSESATGARSALLGGLLSLLAGQSPPLPSRSRFLSADMAHGLHPNYPEVHDQNQPIQCGGGPVIKLNVNQRYATDSEASAEFAAICDDHQIEYQTYSHRADISCGSTIGPAVAHGLGMSTIDIGMAQLSMHSAREVMAAPDIDAMVASFTHWLAAPIETASRRSLL